MRLILTILLIGLFKADAQIVINASAPYRPFISANFFLDQYTGASGAYSLRKLRSAYTGAAVRVRKDTTGQPEQDVGFVGNDLDTASLKSFLNARNGFVVTWYDQSTNGRNATQATQANQPRIANLGVIDRIAGDPSIFFDGTNDHLRADGVASDFTGEDKPITAITVVNKTNNNTTGNYMSFGRSTNDLPFIQINLSNTSAYGFSFRDDTGIPSQTITGTYAANTNYLIFSNSSGLSRNIYSNNNTITSSIAYNIGAITLDRFTIGALTRSGLANYFGGYISENILYSSDKGGDRSGMQTNINSYYGIY